MNAVQLLCSLALILVASFRIFAQEPELPLKEQVNTDEGTICVYERGEHREKMLFLLVRRARKPHPTIINDVSVWALSLYVKSTDDYAHL